MTNRGYYKGLGWTLIITCKVKINFLIKENGSGSWIDARKLADNAGRCPVAALSNLDWLSD